MSDDEEKRSSKPEKESSSSREEHKKHRDDSSRKVEERGRRRHRKRRDDDSDSGSSSSDSDSSDDRRRKRHRKKKHKRRSKSRRKDRKRRKHKRRRRKYSSDSSSSSSDESSSDESKSGQTKKKVVNQRLLQKLAERGETLEEREQRRAERRAARITAQFGYTTQDNPFNDPNIAETFTWKKKNDVKPAAGKKKDQTEIINEIEKVRKRRRDYEEQKEEMERIRAEESRMKELENYDEWAKKEEEFHLLQQRQRSAIRLVEGREKPIDVLAKNLLMFGLSDREKEDRAKVKYQEKYNAFNELENLEAELDEPHVFLKDLKLHELEKLLVDIHSFRMLERDVSGDEENTVTKYWDAIHLVTKAEIQDLKSTENGNQGNTLQLKEDIQKMFAGQSRPALDKMKIEVETKIKKCIMAGGNSVTDDDGGVIDMPYWQTVLDALLVHLAKMDLSDIHSKMLVCQLEQLEKKKEELSKTAALSSGDKQDEEANRAEDEALAAAVPDNVEPDFGNLEEELGLTDELDMGESSYTWQDRFRPRKPRYFNRVKTGYDWNKYNQTHYDHDNPPPKTVQGYKFNIFYPDLIDRTQTPQFFLEPTKSKEYCIIRFHAGPPYEDVAFKIINREWNKSRNRGYKCTFERGVLSLYFNFKTHWYRK